MMMMMMRMPVVVEDDVARIFMRSVSGIHEYPDSHYTPLVRYFVSLGRKVQDPLVEYAGLMNSGSEISP